MALHRAIESVQRQTDEEMEADETFVRRRRVTYKVKLKQEENNYWGDDPLKMTSDERLPQYGTAWVSFNGLDTDLGCRCLRAVAARRTDTTTLEFTYTYSTVQNPLSGNVPAIEGVGLPGGRQGGTGSTDDPTQWQPNWTWDYEEIEVPMRVEVLDEFTAKVWQQNSRHAVLNSANDIIDPLPTRPAVIDVLTYTRYERKWNPRYWRQFRYRVNRDRWRGCDRYTVLCLPPKVGQWVSTAGKAYFPVTYVLKFMTGPGDPPVADRFKKPKPNQPVPEDNGPFPTWHAYIDSYGYKQLVDGKLQPIQVEGEASATTIPRPLDFAGRHISQPDPTDEAKRPARLMFGKFATADFNELNFVKGVPY